MSPSENEYHPTPDEQALIDGTAAQLQSLQAEMKAVLNAIMRARHLQGNWIWDGGKFTRSA